MQISEYNVNGQILTSDRIATERCSDSWTWVALYHGDEFVAEYENTESGPVDHGFKDVDQDRVALFVLVPCKPELKMHYVAIDPTRDERPMFYRRRYIDGASLAEKGFAEVGATVHIIGVKTLGTSQETYLFIYEDGSSMVSTDYQAV